MFQLQDELYKKHQKVLENEKVKKICIWSFQ